MANTILQDIPIKEIKQHLPHGSIIKIARKLNKHRETVSGVLAGNWYNEEILAEAVQIIEADRKKKALMATKLKAVINS